MEIFRIDMLLFFFYYTSFLSCDSSFQQTAYIRVNCNLQLVICTLLFLNYVNVM